MRVLFVVHTFPPLSMGGAETYAHAHARALAARGHDVTVLTREAVRDQTEYSTRVERRDGLDVVWLNNTFRTLRSFAESYANPEIDAAAGAVIDACRPDIAHVHHLTCLSTGIIEELRRRNVPVVFTLHDYWLFCHRGQLLDTDFRPCDGPGEDGCAACLGAAGGVGTTAFAAARVVRAMEERLPAAPAKWLRDTASQAAALVAGRGDDAARARLIHMRHVLADVTLFLAPSEALAARFAEWGVPADRISFWPLGFDGSPFARVSRPAPGVGSAPLRLGFLGALTVSKAPHLVIDAITGLTPGAATADLFGGYVPYHGDDSYRETIDRLASTPGATWHGPIAHDDVPAALATIDALVVPSIWPENSPLVIREAFLAGVPVIGSRIGGIPEAVKHGVNGLLFDAGDVTGLRDAIQSLIDSPDLLSTLSHGARTSVVRSLDDDVEATERLYQSLLVRDRPRLAAVVLHFGNPDETRIAVSRLLASRRPIDDLIVVDNDPARRCGGVLAGVRDRIVYLESKTNLGFSGCINLGIRDALERGAQRILILNNDVVVPPDAIDALERAIEADARVGCVGPAVLSRSNPSVVSTMGMSFDAGTGRMRHPESGKRADAVINGERGSRVIDGISGCAMLLTRRAVEATGLFDESYFFSFEDLDWCLRARRAGFTSVVVSAARVYHQGSASMGESPERLYYAARNHLRLAAIADGDGRIGHALRATSIVGLNLAHAVRATGGTMRSRVAAVIRGVRDA
jgi:GT2 family glycosyltransferase/glycosyltransferase involved in cell wall biosynthesis